jgi:hypothetical protein
VKKATIKYKNVEPIVADGLKYLADFSSSIDLLYLDFWVPDPDGALPGTGRCRGISGRVRRCEEQTRGPVVDPD